MKHVDFSVLKGKVIVEISGMEKDSEEILIKCSDGTVYKMYHEQDYSENVWLEDVSGEVSNLLNTPILGADLTTDTQEVADWSSRTYSYYHLKTLKGYVDLRWLGESNGYYSEEVDFVEIQQSNNQVEKID